MLEIRKREGWPKSQQDPTSILYHILAHDLRVLSHDSSVLWFKNPKEADIPVLKEKASKILELTSNQLVQDSVRQFQRTAWHTVCKDLRGTPAE